MLVIAPAMRVGDGPWRRFPLPKYQLGVDLLSCDQIADDRQLNDEGSGFALGFDVSEYAMVVIDEATTCAAPPDSAPGRSAGCWADSSRISFC
ncbi:MAG: hypothetical protein M5U31_00345 [Acidimicrobiia bacterium]|nr:hypothetical protein [Acidimicrobiia bacterium]